MNLFLISLVMLSISDTKVVKVVDNVNVGGTTILTVRGSDASSRVDIILDRMKFFLNPELQSSDFKIQKFKNGDSAICVQDKVLITITKKDAALNKSTVEQLSQLLLKSISAKMLEVKPLN